MMARRWPVGWAAMLLALAGAALAVAQERPPNGAEKLHAPRPVPPSAVAAKPELSLSLEECLYLALRKQPALAAERASLAVAEESWRAAENLALPTFLARELPVRRQQAALGIGAAKAAVHEAEHDTVYAVTRTYFTVIYAREQEKVAGGIVERLRTVGAAAQQQLDAGARDITAADVQKTQVYVEMAEVRRIQAAKGVDRALSLLREAIGLGPDCAVVVPAGSLPEPSVRPVKQEVIAAALTRRGDLAAVSIFHTLTCLEIEAQSLTNHLKMDTFAIGADIHARPTPLGSYDPEYRPGAVGPEMPVMLFGTRDDRMSQAQALHVRAGFMAEKARNLIALEAEDAFHRWEQAAEQTASMRRAVDNGDKMADSLQKDFAANLKVKVEDLMTAQVLAAQARSQFNEYLHAQLAALADLQRITAGAFSPGLAGAPRPPAVCLVIK